MAGREWFQGFNLPVLEAAACGTPVVVSRGGPTDDFTHPSWARYVATTRVTRPDGSSILQVDEQDLQRALKWVVHGGSGGTDSANGGGTFRVAARRAAAVHIRSHNFTWAAAATRLLQVAVAAHTRAMSRMLPPAAAAPARCSIIASTAVVPVECYRALFGGSLPAFGQPVEALIAPAAPADACSPLHAAITPYLAGAVAVVARGTCGFAEKALRVQKHGAVGVVIVNHPGAAGGPPDSTSPAASAVSIPVFMVQRPADSALAALLSSNSSMFVAVDGTGVRTAQYLTSLGDQLAATGDEASAQRHFQLASRHSFISLSRPHLGAVWLQRDRYDWRAFELHTRLLRQSLRSFGTVSDCRDVHPGMHIPSEVLFRLCHMRWTTAMTAGTPIDSADRSNQHLSLRVGVISSSLDEHPVGRLLRRLFGELSTLPSASLVCISSGRGNRILPAIRDACPKLLFVNRGQHTSSTDAVRRVQRLKLDVLVDLDAVTGSRTHVDIVAHNTAVLNFHYLGQPLRAAASPSGDYFMANKHAVVVELEGTTRHWSKRVNAPGLLLLPKSFYIDASGRRIPPSPPRAAPTKLEAQALPNHRDMTVFCAFNQAKKTSPLVWTLWMQALARSPRAVLWLSPFTSKPASAQSPQSSASIVDTRRPWSVSHNLQEEHRSRGRGAAQIVQAAWAATREDHLERLRLADVFVDTLSFTAGSVGVEAMQAGVPVLTCPQTSHASRQGFRYAGCS